MYNAYHIYAIDWSPGKVIVTLANNSAEEWRGRIATARPRGTLRAREWVDAYELASRQSSKGRAQLPAGRQ